MNAAVLEPAAEVPAGAPPADTHKGAAERIRATTRELSVAAATMRDRVEEKENRMRRFYFYRLWAALRDSIAVH